MSNSTLVITLQSPRSTADLKKLIKDTSEPREEARALEHLFLKIGSGVELANWDVQYSASAPVRASNTITVTFGSMSNGDTVVIAGTTLTAETGTPSGGAQFKMVTSTTVTAANLIACINANTTLNLLMVATGGGSSGAVTLTLFAHGAIGNQVPLVGSAGMVAATAHFASGAGGSETAAVNYKKGI